MKRTLTILTVLTLLTGALFATDPYLTGGDTIKLNATVNTVDPEFKFYGSLNSDFSGEKVEGGPGAVLETGKDLTKEGEGFEKYAVNAYFKVYQSKTSRYKGNLKITLNASQFTSTDGTGDAFTTTRNYISAWGGLINHPSDGIAEADVTSESHPESGLYLNETCEVTVKYLKESPVEPRDIVCFSIHWKAEDKLAASTNYTATVSVKIEPTT